MKTKSGFFLRKMGESAVVVALGEESKRFHGLIRLNAVGAFLWEQLSKAEQTPESLLAAVLDTYDVTESQASQDIAAFLENMRHARLLCESAT